ncbi:DUF4304 domain-containing protein [Christiangramia sp. LLG6405-1]|uniref:DUF4304 domain-containing protein n=1 Tax=Christiangramia sp. LLG6405-1 TaxID=3160832 RepID=UPI0038653809
MNSKELKAEFDKYLVPLGFNKKNLTWVKTEIEISQIVNLQKSSFNNQYYLNEGYNLVNAKNDSFHIQILSSSKYNASKEYSLIDILNLDNQIAKKEREEEIENLIKNFIVPNLERLKSESDLKEYLVNLKVQNHIPVFIKEYFKIK